ncbi:Pyruvate carboxyltransferase [Senna tora]|uniref:Pyruvate carboxyltransferase n=1 Tax=Senna tora TaxID=362788 RepID=A0A834TIX7_9FABA|nr:Pyruvate carboxyltransferase [Senna tora]
MSVVFMLPCFWCISKGPVLEVADNYWVIQRAMWSRRVIAAIIDKNDMPDFRLQAIINSQWKLQGQVLVRAKVNNFFVLELSNEDDRLFMLTNGPWAVQNRLLVLDKWVPGASMDKLRVGKIAVWFKFTGFPFELISNTIAFKLGSIFGEVVADPYNDEVANIHYLRAKVMIDPSKPLFLGTFIPLDNGKSVWINCTPERTYRVCEQCGRIGHLAKDCDWSVLKTMYEMHVQWNEIGMNQGLQFWMQPNVPHFQCPRRKCSKWHYSSSTKVQVEYDEFGFRYVVSDLRSEHAGTNTINAEFSSNSDSSNEYYTQNSSFKVQQPLQEVSPPSVNIQNEVQEASPILQAEQGVTQVAQGGVVVHAVEASYLGNDVQLEGENTEPVCGNNDDHCFALNAEDMQNLSGQSKAVGKAIQDGNISQDYQHLLCLEDITHLDDDVSTPEFVDGFSDDMMDTEDGPTV